MVARFRPLRAGPPVRDAGERAVTPVSRGGPGPSRVRMACAGIVLHALVGVAAAKQVPVAFVSNMLSGSLSSINAEANALIDTVPLGATLRRIAVAPSRRFIYVVTNS